MTRTGSGGCAYAFGNARGFEGDPPGDHEEAITAPMPTTHARPDQPTHPDQTWLFYDGNCRFCRRCVAWLQARDQQGKLRPVPYQEAPDPPLIPPLRSRAKHSVLTIGPDGRIRFAGRAVLATLAEVGWMTPLVRVAALPPLVWLVEIGYRIVAANRDRLSRLLFRERCAACGD